MMQSAKERFFLNRSSFAARLRNTFRNPIDPLMWSVMIIIIYVLFYNPSQVTFRKNDKVIQTFLPYRPDKSLCKWIHVGRIWSNTDTFDVVLFIGEPFEFSGIIMDKIRTRIVIWESLKTPVGFLEIPRRKPLFPYIVTKYDNSVFSTG